MLKRGILFLVILTVVGTVAADSEAPDYYDLRIQYSSGTVISNWTTICDTVTDNNAHDDNGAGPDYNCTAYIDQDLCDEEGTVQYQWRVWHEPDAGLPYVYDTLSLQDAYTINYDGDEADCECLLGPGNWALGGDYTHPDCCGDDANEYKITTHASVACCNNPTDFVHTGNICEPLANKRNVYGYVYGEVPGGATVPLQGANVVVANSNYRTVNADPTDASGYYDVTIPAGTFHISAQKQGYEAVTMQNMDLSSSRRVDFTLSLTSQCQPDCTRYDGIDIRCDKDCEGVNGCSFDPNVVSTYYGGETMKNLCDQKKKGWTVSHNATEIIKCCSEGYIPKLDPTQALIQYPNEIKDIQTFFAGIVNYEPTGELYSVYVVIYSKE